MTEIEKSKRDYGAIADYRLGLVALQSVEETPAVASEALKGLASKLYSAKNPKDAKRLTSILGRMDSEEDARYLAKNAAVYAQAYQEEVGVLEIPELITYFNSTLNFWIPEDDKRKGRMAKLEKFLSGYSGKNLGKVKEDFDYSNDIVKLSKKHPKKVNEDDLKKAKKIVDSYQPLLALYSQLENQEVQSLTSKLSGKANGNQFLQFVDSLPEDKKAA